jgi:hypothetical protein
MPCRFAVAFGFALLAALSALALGACSSSQRRDQSYGTDAGAGYQPEAAAFSNPQPSDAADVALEDASAESAQDAGAHVDF